MRSGFTVIDCPHCGCDQLHAIALIGQDIYLCCRECRMVSLGGAEGEGAMVAQRRSEPVEIRAVE